MQRANELCNHMKTLLLERSLSEITLYACDFCGSNTIVDNLEDFIEVFGDTLPWDDLDINDFTWDDSRDLYGTLREYNHHGGLYMQIVRRIRSMESGLEFKIERRCFNTFEEVEYYEESKLFSLEQLVREFGEESVTAHLESIYRTLTSAEWLFELNNMKKS